MRFAEEDLSEGMRILGEIRVSVPIILDEGQVQPVGMGKSVPIYLASADDEDLFSSWRYLCERYSRRKGVREERAFIPCPPSKHGALRKLLESCHVLRNIP